MTDLDYTPNPTFHLESCENDDNVDTTNYVPDVEDDKKREGLSVKIPPSRGSESPSINTPIVSNKLKNCNDFVQLLIRYLSKIMTGCW